MGIDIELNLIKLHLITYYDRIELNLKQIYCRQVPSAQIVCWWKLEEEEKFNWNKTLTKLNQITLK